MRSHILGGLDQSCHCRGRRGFLRPCTRRRFHPHEIELHPEENGRTEFKAFEMTPRLMTSPTAKCGANRRLSKGFPQVGD